MWSDLEKVKALSQVSLGWDGFEWGMIEIDSHKMLTSSGKEQIPEGVASISEEPKLSYRSEVTPDGGIMGTESLTFRFFGFFAHGMVILV